MRSESPGWLSNTWLIADRPGGHGVVIDTGGPPEPIWKRIEEERITVTHVLCTHHHPDHVEHNDAYRARYGCPVCGHHAEASLFGDLQTELQGDEVIQSGDLSIRALHIPGHTLGQLAFLVDEEDLFTGDTLFRGSVGGTRGSGHTTFEDLRHSIVEVLMAMPHRTRVHPGHVESTTLEREWSDNPFLRAWRGLESPGDDPVRAFGQAARLRLRAPDYDGGTKCWVEFEDSGEDAVVPGSRVEPR